MPSVRVCVLRCRNHGSLHSFPNRETDRLRREKWHRLLHVSASDRSKKIFACSRHFSMRQIAIHHLRQDAVPDMNLPEPSSDIGIPSTRIIDHNYSLSQNSNACIALDVDDASATGHKSDSDQLASKNKLINTQPEVRKLYIKLKDPETVNYIAKSVNTLPIIHQRPVLQVIPAAPQPATPPEVISFDASRQVLRLIEPTPGNFVKVLEQIYEPGFQPITPATATSLTQVFPSPSPEPVPQSPPAIVFPEDDEPVVRVSFKPTKPHRRIFADPLETDALASREVLAQNCQEEGFITLVNRGTQTELALLKSYAPELQSLLLENRELMQQLQDKEKEVRGLKTLLSLSQSKDIRLGYVHVKNT